MISWKYPTEIPGSFSTTKTRASSSCSGLTWQSLPPGEADGIGGTDDCIAQNGKLNLHTEIEIAATVFSNKISIFHDGYLYRFTSLNSFKLRKYKKRHGKLQCLWLKVTVIKIGETKTKLVGGFNPFEKYQSKWESSPIFGVKTKIYLKPPP